MDLGQKIVQLERDITALQRGSRLGHASIENAAVLVNDGTGSLRGILGVQADGTTAVTIVNGAAPPQPSAPVVTSVLGGVTVTWDGLFDAGAILPLDWQRVEVHASGVNGFTPDASTLQGTIETPQGATVVVVTNDPVYVRLMARNTSGTASTPSVQVGPLGPTPVVADDILDGIVTEVKLANDAVTQAKIAAGAVGTTELADAAVHAQQLADAAVEVAKIAADAVTGPAIAADAVSADKIAANAVTTVKLNASAVTSAKVAAGAITTDKLTVTGGANILTDPSFAGAYTAALVAGSTFATQDLTAGNGTLDSLKIDATSASPAFRSVALTSVATLPGEKWYLAVDYWVSTDWVGTEISIHARWETAAGAVISYSKAVTTTPVREGWTRLEATVTAPATTYRIVPRVESGSATAGFVRFDNAVVRPVLGGTQIQDGAITTEKVVAGGIQATNIAAGSVLTDKLAALAVTTAKLDALAVTADKIAANSITVGKLAAGAVDATALAADAITGKTITGGTITGALIQTAASGLRITLNEGGANKVLVYPSSGGAIAELSATGLLVKGTNGAILWLDPNNAFPNFKLTNAAGTKSAVINISGADAVLGMNSGLFTGPDTFTDWKWRTVFGGDSSGSTDLWVAERVRESSPSTTFLGGRIFLAKDFATFGYRDASAATAEGYVYCAPGAVTVFGSLTVNGVGQRTPKRRTTNATRTSTVTPTADSQLTWSVDANSVYALEGVLFYSGPGDFLMGWTYPSGAAGTWQGLGNGTTVVSGTAGGGTQQDTTSSWGYTVRTETTDLADNRTYGGISTTGFAVQVRATIRVGATAGTFALQWAQGTSNATATTLFTDSRLTLEKIG